MISLAVENAGISASDDDDNLGPSHLLQFDDDHSAGNSIIRKRITRPSIIMIIKCHF